MFFAGSRYLNTGTYTLTRPDGSTIRVAKLPFPLNDPMIGFHRRLQGQRLDLIASHYLADATTFWRLCDVNNSVIPDALAARPLIGIPGRGL